MEFSMCALILVTFNAFLFSPARSDARVFLAGRYCSSELNSLQRRAEAANNFFVAMTQVTSEVNLHKWGAWNVTLPEPAVGAFGQCHEDLSIDECNLCMSTAKISLQKCLPAVSAVVYLDGCMIRYHGGVGGNNDSVILSSGKIRCGATTETTIVGDPVMKSEFAKKVNKTTMGLARITPMIGGFGLMLSRGGVDDVYVLGMCWRTVRTERCSQCLLDAGSRLTAECANESGAGEGRAMFDDCYMKYSIEKFFDSDPSRDNEESARGWIVIAGVLSATVLALIAIFCVYFGYRRFAKKKTALIGKTFSNFHNSSLNFKYEILERATDYFDQSRKLGQGGSGSVFKGILPDGKIIAVKRLFFSTRQWVDEFFNEVNLIHGIEHKNLVKLLGCSIEGPESLLVYEFVPNRSLDQILFDKNTMTTLIWQQRFDIITGMAEGLAYLHDGCGLRIIHRDVKASNILLDDNFMAKLADFGLARSVSNDRTHISTGIAGTLGYMAPEYLVRGQLTEKADVYAFGVLVLEIVCGRRNSAFTLGSNSILHKVWQLYNEKKITECVDSTLSGIFNVREASNVLQIGLLCTQASVSLRPTMFDVIEMLDSGSDIPSPNQPPFLNSTMLTPNNELKSDSSSPIQSEISCSFTANSSTIYDTVGQTSVS